MKISGIARALCVGRLSGLPCRLRDAGELQAYPLNVGRSIDLVHQRGVQGRKIAPTTGRSVPEESRRRQFLRPELLHRLRLPNLAILDHPLNFDGIMDVLEG